jgi:hypothetical protein
MGHPWRKWFDIKRLNRLRAYKTPESNKSFKAKWPDNHL